MQCVRYSVCTCSDRYPACNVLGTVCVLVATGNRHAVC
jgi:hypothetical protein